MASGISNVFFDVGDRGLVLAGRTILPYASTKPVPAERLGNNFGWAGDMVLATAGVVACSWHEKCIAAILSGDGRRVRSSGSSVSSLHPPEG